MGLFGSKSSSNSGAVTAHDRAVLELKIQRDKLTVYRTKVDQDSIRTMKTRLSLWVI